MPAAKGLLFLTGRGAGRRRWAAAHCFQLFIRAVRRVCTGNSLVQDSGSSELLYGHTSPSAGQKSLQNCRWSKAHALFFAKPAKSCFSDFNNLSAAVARAEKGQEQQTRTPHNSTPLGRCVSPCAISGAHECSPWGLKQSTGSSRSGSL